MKRLAGVRIPFRKIAVGATVFHSAVSVYAATAVESFSSFAGIEISFAGKRPGEIERPLVRIGILVVNRKVQHAIDVSDIEASVAPGVLLLCPGERLVAVGVLRVSNDEAATVAVGIHSQIDDAIIVEVNASRKRSGGINIACRINVECTTTNVARTDDRNCPLERSVGRVFRDEAVVVSICVAVARDLSSCLRPVKVEAFAAKK